MDPIWIPAALVLLLCAFTIFVVILDRRQHKH